MLDCPNIGCWNKEARQLIACDVAKKVVCDKCHPEHSRNSLGGVIVKDQYGLTAGKISEIENRSISKDGKVKNVLTDKPAQR